MKRGLCLIFLVFAFLVIHADGLWSTEFLVSTVAQLESALSAAGANGEDDIIKVAQGTYFGSFAYSSVEGNRITLEGGYSSDFSVRVIDPMYTVLDAQGNDHVLLIDSAGDIEIDGFTIQNGYAGSEGSGGGGISAVSDIDNAPSGNIVIANNIIRENETARAGGGIYAHSRTKNDNAGSIWILHNIIENNSAQWTGGVDVSSVSSEGVGNTGDIHIIGNSIIGNTAYGIGGGGGGYSKLYAYDGDLGSIFIDNNTIRGNHYLRSNTGGMVVTCIPENNDMGGSVNITNNIIKENVTPTGFSSGGILVWFGQGLNPQAEVNIINNVIVENSAGSGAGVVIIDRRENSDGDPLEGGITFTNNTISENSADRTGGVEIIGSFAIDPSGICRFYNNIIWNNIGGDIELEDLYTNLGFNNDYSTMTGNWTESANNIHTDPLFYGGGDYHLQPTSPCVDSGDNLAYLLPLEDREGNLRIFDGDSDGFAVVDMGAYEYFTSEAQIENLIEDVGDLIETGELNSGQGTSLNTKLDMVQNRINSGNITAACNLLGAFINQVNSYIDSGVLSPEDGQALIDAASRLKNELCGS